MKVITGLQFGFIGGFTSPEMMALLKSDEAYIRVRTNGREELRVPLTDIPTMNPTEWFDIRLRPLPLNRTRFNCPAWVMLRSRTEER